MFSEVMASYHSDPFIKDLMAELMVKTDPRSHFKHKAGILRYKGKLMIGPSEKFRQKLIQGCHDTAVRAHLGIKGTCEQLNNIFGLT